MITSSKPETDTSDRDIKITRIFAAPRELVFEAWTSHEHLSHWFGPAGFSITTRAMEFRVGGVWSFTMHGPDGTDYPNRVEYLEIAPHTHIRYRQGTSEEDPEWFRTKVSFVEVSGGTELTLHTIFPTAEARNLVVEKYGAIEGGHQTLARLAQVVEARAHESQPSDQRPIRISREFDAPRTAVFAAWASADALQRWYFPYDCSVIVREFDFRPGGGFLCGIKPAGDGKACWCRCEYQEITEPQRIVLTLGMCDEQGKPANPVALGMDPQWPAETVVTLNFDELMGGRTRLTLHQTVSEALANRTGALPSWHSMLDHLAALLATES